MELEKVLEAFKKTYNAESIRLQVYKNGSGYISDGRDGFYVFSFGNLQELYAHLGIEEEKDVEGIEKYYAVSYAGVIEKMYIAYNIREEDGEEVATFVEFTKNSEPQVYQTAELYSSMVRITRAEYLETLSKWRNEIKVGDWVQTRNGRIGRTIKAKDSSMYVDIIGTGRNRPILQLKDRLTKLTESQAKEIILKQFEELAKRNGDD